MGAVAGFLPGLPRCHARNGGGARGPGHGCRRRFPAGFAPHAVPGRGWRAGVPWAWVPSEVSCRLCPAVMPGMGWCGCPGHGCRRRLPAGLAPHAIPGRGWRAGVPWAGGAVGGFLPGLPRCHARNGVAHGVLGMDAAAGFLPALPRMPCPGGDGARECLGHGCRRRFPAGFAPHAMPGMGWRTGSWAWMPPQVSCRLCPACRTREGYGWRKAFILPLGPRALRQMGI